MATQKPIATVTVPEDLQGARDIKLEIMREVGQGADWHNRYVRHAETKEVLYYCVREPDVSHNDTKLIIHRGGKDGPILATADPCDMKKYQTDIRFADPPLLIPLQHKHHSHHYECKGSWFHWKGHKELLDDSNHVVVAKFHASPFEGTIETLEVGTLSIGIKEEQDIAVVTALVVQERDEEYQGAYEAYWKRAAELK